MANEPFITVCGNLTADPERRVTQNGVPVASFTIASTPRNFDRQTNEWRDGEALFLRASVWREYAEHVAGSLRKGMRVIATGRLRQRSYQDRDGNTRTSLELEVDEIGPSLRYATAAVTKATNDALRGHGATNTDDQGWYSPDAGSGRSTAEHDPWGAPGQYGDDTPF